MVPAGTCCVSEVYCGLALKMPYNVLVMCLCMLGLYMRSSGPAVLLDTSLKAAGMGALLRTPAPCNNSLATGALAGGSWV